VQLSPLNDQAQGFGQGLVHGSPLRTNPVNPNVLFNQCSTGKNIYKDCTSPMPGEFAVQLNYLANNQNATN